MSTENKNWISEEDSPRLKFTRNWENSMDFPTHEVSESQVRKDMQALHDEVKDFINDEVIADLVRLGVGEIARAPAGAGFKYVRLNRDRVFEVSNDGIEWEATSSSGGHLILNESGEFMPQRSRIKFEGSKVTDEDDTIVVSYGDDGSLERHDADPDAHVSIRETAGIFSDFVIEKIETSTVWTAPKARNQQFRVYAVGGGGAGGASSGDYTCGGGGGGGGYVEIRDIVIPEGEEVSIVCGAGGLSTSDKGNGGATQFGAYVSANGGKGGRSGGYPIYTNSSYTSYCGGAGGDGGAGGGGGAAYSNVSGGAYGGNGGNGGTYGGGGGAGCRNTSGDMKTDSPNYQKGGSGGTYGGGGGCGLGYSGTPVGGGVGTGGTVSAPATGGRPLTHFSLFDMLLYAAEMRSFPHTSSGMAGGGGGEGSRGGLGGSYGTSSKTYYCGGGGGGLVGNGGDGTISNSSPVSSRAGGGGGNFCGNGGAGLQSGGGGGGLFCDGADGGQYGGGGGGGIVPGSAAYKDSGDNWRGGEGGHGGVYILYFIDRS